MFRQWPTRVAIASMFLLGQPVDTRAQAAETNLDDVSTIVNLVRASYEVISGPAGQPRQWQRDATLYMPNATIVSVSETEGLAQASIMTPEDYRRRVDATFVARGMFETEVGRRVERFGNVAQVRSVAVIRRSPDGPIEGRYVNYFQLFWDRGRWWIAGIVWGEEGSGEPIPDSWIGHWEEFSPEPRP